MPYCKSLSYGTNPVRLMNSYLNLIKAILRTTFLTIPPLSYPNVAAIYFPSELMSEATDKMRSFAYSGAHKLRGRLFYSDLEDFAMMLYIPILSFYFLSKFPYLFLHFFINQSLTTVRDWCGYIYLSIYVVF